MTGEVGAVSDELASEARPVLAPPAAPRANREELTPLSFLARAAAAFGDRTALVHGERRLTYRDLQRRSPPAGAGAARRGSRTGDRVAVLAPEQPAAAGEPLRRAAHRRACWSPEHPPRRRRDRLHPGALGRALPARGHRAHAAGGAGAGALPGPRAGRLRRGYARGVGRARPGVRVVPGRGRPGCSAAAAGERGRPDHHQLHQRHHRPAEGRRCTPTAAPT